MVIPFPSKEICEYINNTITEESNINALIDNSVIVLSFYRNNKDLLLNDIINLYEGSLTDQFGSEKERFRAIYLYAVYLIETLIISSLNKNEEYINNFHFVKRRIDYERLNNYDVPLALNFIYERINNLLDKIINNLTTNSNTPFQLLQKIDDIDIYKAFCADYFCTIGKLTEKNYEAKYYI